jgi:NAD+ kinase
MKIGVIANRTKPGAAALLRQLHKVCAEAGVELFLEASTAQLIRQSGLQLPVLLKKVDLLLVAGGDGSLLRVLHEIYPAPIPLLGINIGRLGFLTAMTGEEILGGAVNILSGRQKLRFSPRLALKAVVHHSKGEQTIPCALNDIVVFRGNATRMVRMRVLIDDTLVNEYTADGLIVATPTGSTAYSMAAGGPIISPETKAFYLNPICPHSLSNRGLVFAPESVLRVEIPTGASTVQLQYDGRPSARLRAGDWLEVRAAQHPVMLAFLAERDFFQILRQKLKWSGASV